MDGHFNDPRSLARGLDYALTAHEMCRWYGNFSNDQDRVDSAAQLIVQQWIMRDVLARQEAGASDVSAVGGTYDVGWTLNDPIRAAYTHMIGERGLKARKKYPQFET